ncbi:MAG: hypothetical protein WCO26_25080 [Deltaproteobacteria bacterium]
MDKEEFKTGSWFERVLENILDTLGPNPDDIKVDGTSQKMIRKASRAAFLISTGAGIPTGPMGLATIVPEVVALIKLQIDLIFKVAKFHQQEAKVNKTIILTVLGVAMGVVLKHALVNKVGTRLIVKALSAEGAKRITREIGEKFATGLLKRGLGRWIPLMLAPVFGYLSLSMTRKVGREAESLFSHELEVD